MQLVTESGVTLQFEWAENTVAQWYRRFCEQPVAWAAELVTAGDRLSLERELAQLVGRPLPVIDQQTLNQLHLEFESQQSWSHRWHRINQVIHQIEQCDRPQRRIVRVRAVSDLRRPIMGREFDLFDHCPEGGDFCISYGTIGKSLYNCWQDQDLELIAQGRVTRQTELHSQAHIVLEPGARLEHQQIVAEVTEWLKTVPGGQQYLDPQYHHHGQALIARVKDRGQMWRFAQAIAGGDRIWEWRCA